MKIAIYGPGGFGRELVRSALDAVEAAGGGSVVFVSDDPSEIGGVVCGLPVIGPDALDCPAVVAVGDAAVRRRIADRITAGSLAAATHRRGPDVVVGEGAVFCDFTVVTASARIGRHFHCNIYSYVAHDCVIGDFVTFAPNVCCNGNVHIEDDVYVGTGAILRQGARDKPLRIGKGAIIGMGAVVTKDVPPGVTVIGNPAKPMETRPT
ncbi:sugar O-acyltransferase (sialic acid O-acetyltransferase NeuD family) [Brevundimonas alba]|uniref:Sugar O-acyltransferase (Sialic acid O-acetyltransferase NeuD family) n=1 Tax=Brevundimonas alba TaxID=74314 RepID=A0A7X5YJW0_9CAUL|nr:NeuD/PglB/VioB family sugar acetyltransferase [Brevundimonas alba]NJC41291.1 sugar O-acyltransferase (sialic acid O-acetyltransferase NeuD family) [Brevundimonas alba]